MDTVSVRAGRGVKSVMVQILCHGIKPGHRDVEQRVRRGRDIERDVIGTRSGVGVEDGLPQ